jgi:hypothetical protein
LLKNGWPAPFDATLSLAEFDAAMAAVTDVRRAAVAVETANRESGVGTSFVWSYLDSIRVISVKTQGDRAVATVEWSNDRVEMRFVKDRSGWRFEPNVEPPE